MEFTTRVKKLICKLFINGKQVAVNESDVAYDSLVPYATPTDNLKIGGGLAAKFINLEFILVSLITGAILPCLPPNFLKKLLR